MEVRILLEKIEELRKDNPNIDDMQIGPIFYSGGEEVITMVENIKLVPNSSWDNIPEDAIGIEWMA